MSQEGSSPQAGSPDASAGNGEGGARKFGTFGGVFTPSILTILGVVMYLRMGWVVGNVGLAGALIIVVISHLITLSTGMSVASIATNRTVGAGGAYFLISRSLGAPAGAAIGIPLFLGQSLSVTFYIIGFVESITPLVPGLPVRVAGTAILVVLTFISLKSSDLAIKTQFVVMAAIIISLVSFFAGTSSNPGGSIEWWNTEGGASFGKVFAVFFPAVTGIMAGVGMSGDLKDPRKALPRGTLFAIFVGFFVYMAFPVWLSLNASNKVLIENKNIVWDIALVPALIFVGVWGATISSAIGSILTAPRTMLALAQDRLLPRALAQTSKTGEPQVGTLVTFALAEVGILLGNLDAIANILTMFFLATYGFTNLACGLEKWAASPSYRPEFKTPAWVSLAGAAGCFYVMSIIDLGAMVLAFVLLIVIYLWVQRRNLDTTYGDARHGMWSALVRTALHRLKRTEFHQMNWRPNLIVLGGGFEERPHLLELGSTIVQDRGIVTYFQLLEGRIRDFASRRRKMMVDLDSRISDKYPNVFSRVDIVDDLHKGVVNVAQLYGLGNFESNSVMLGWPRNDEHIGSYISMLRDLVRIECSIFLVHYRPALGFGKRQTIHVWWRGQPATGSLMLLMSFLITANHRWRRAKVTVFRVVDDKSEIQNAEEEIGRIIAASRIEAETRIIERKGRDLKDVVQKESGGADLAFMGLPAVETRPEEFYRAVQDMLDVLPTTILVRSAIGFQSAQVLGDEDATEPKADAKADAKAEAKTEPRKNGKGEMPPETDAPPRAGHRRRARRTLRADARARDSDYGARGDRMGAAAISLMLTIALAPSASEPVPGRIGIAVLDTEGKGALPDGLASSLGPIMASTLSRTGVFTVVTQEDVRRMIDFDEVKTALACDEAASCLAEIGGALGVPYLVTSTLSRVGPRLSLSVVLIDIERAQSVARRTEMFDDADALGARIGPVVERLVAPLLSAQRGTLNVTASEEGATVRVDGDVVGTTPLVEFTLAAGLHELELTKEGFVREARDVRIPAQGARSVDVTLRPSTEFARAYRTEAWAWRGTALGLAGASAVGALASGGLIASYFLVVEGLAGDKGRNANGNVVLTPDEAGLPYALWFGGLAAGGVALVALGGATGAFLLGPDPGRYDAVLEEGAE